MTFEELAAKEWLLTNGIGGFASGTLAGCATRRYHSLLTVALDPPSGRRMSLLGGLDETVIIDGIEYPLSTHVYEDGTVFPEGWKYLQEHKVDRVSVNTDYRVESKEPVEVQKQVCMLPNRNMLWIEYATFGKPTAWVENERVQIRLAPLVCWKEVHSEMHEWEGFPYRSEPLSDNRGWLVQATQDAPPLYLYAVIHKHSNFGKWQIADWWNQNISHSIELARGFNHTQSLFCPAIVTLPHGCGNLIVTTEDIDIEDILHSSDILEVLEKNFQFIETPINRTSREIVTDFTTTRSVFLTQVPGGRQTILAGYPWFTDWGRDTFISLPGLCLTTGQEETAKQIVRDFVPWIKNGRIPNRFPDNGDEPAYNNVDGTLWFVHCIGLCGLTKELAGPLKQLIGAHLDGTVGDGIFCDADSLLRCGDDHTNLTWMDAKVEGVAITPRYDRPVEVQALWIHALKIAGEKALAKKAEKAFLEKFVRPDGLGLYDCLLPDGTPDASIRPNQVIAAALLDLPEDVNRAVLSVATEHLLTPYGLRTLSPTDPRFCPRYEGGPHQRDAAYHQGTVWPWLTGSFCDLYKKVYGATADVSPFLAELERHLTDDYGLGGIAEIFDGAAPHRPNGCPWQAWSLAEVLRSKTKPLLP